MAWELVDGQLSSVQRWRGLNEPTGHHIRYFNYRRRHYAALETADRVRGRAGIDDVLSSSMCSVLCRMHAMAAVADHEIL